MSGDLLAQRARRLARPPGGDRRQVDALLTRVGGETFAVPLAQLRSVLPVAVTPLPLSAPHVAGVQSVRGTVIAVLRADVLLTGQAGAVSPESRVLLTAALPDTCGLLVDSVSDLVWTGDLTAAAPFGTPGVSGLDASGLARLDLQVLLRHLPPAWPARPPD